MTMTPHRMAQTPQAVDTAVAVVTGSLAAAILADTFSEVNVFLAWLMVVAFGVDFLAGFARMLACEGVHGYSTQKAIKGIGKKIGMGMMVVGAAIVGRALAAVGLTAFGTHTPLLKFALLTVIVSEGASIIRNGGEAAGRQKLAAAIIGAVRNATEIRPGVKVGESGGTHVVTIEDDAEDADA